MLEALSGAMDAIESQSWFVLLDLMFHLVIVGHVAHHVLHACHRHALPWVERAWLWLRGTIAGLYAHWAIGRA